MSPWKKITGLFVILASAGVFAPACAMDATDADQAQTPEDTTTEEPSEGRTTLNNRDWDDRNDRDWRHGRECEERCHYKFTECKREFGRGPDWDRDPGRGYHCVGRLNMCLNLCRHGWPR